MNNDTRTDNRHMIYHMFFWLLYIVYEVLYNKLIYRISAPFPDYAFFYTCNILLFYWHFYILDRCINRIPSRYLLLCVLVITEMAVMLTVKGGWEYFSLIKKIPAAQMRPQFREALGLDFGRNLYYLIISTVVWSGINFGRFRKRTTEALLKTTLAEKANAVLKYQFAQAQNVFLKQQINPHLLFNALNAIYSSVYLNSPNDSKSVLLLSDIMRYSFEEPDPNGRVPLKNELLQMDNLIQLNSYRFDPRTRLDVKIAGDPQPHSIIPLVLITLTENMFKHGDLRLNPRELEVTISEGGQMRFITRNIPKRLKPAEPASHVGLQNTRLRLDYAYPGNYELKLTETADLFILELNINLAYDRSNN